MRGKWVGTPEALNFDDCFGGSQWNVEDSLWTDTIHLRTFPRSYHRIFVVNIDPRYLSPSRKPIELFLPV